MGERKQAPCPRKGCRADISIPADLAEGVYPCICRAAMVRLRWSTGVDFVRTPHLSHEVAP